MKIRISILLLILSICLSAQKDEVDLFQNIKVRNVGPSYVSGRIADIDFHPQDDNIWYVSVGSGGVWKTENAATTWKPLFDKQSCYSIGCLAIDERDPSRIWVGTGENVGGRHVGFGDGIYLSENGGDSWTNMGLKESEHISQIIVHPDNSNVVWVAAQGPLWSKGGQRGVYKTTDGGKTWKRTLGDDVWTGATDLLIDPNDPMVLYAATWDRHRTVAAYMGGGPGSGIHKSTDGGETWTKLTKGIPTSNLGKIGLAMSPKESTRLYAAIELDHKKGGVYMSEDGGSSWTKQSSTVSGGTGPHYYQELYASPHQEGRLYLMDVRVQVSDDYGKTFRRLQEKEKHSDNHAIAFKEDDPDYIMLGTDAGIYESFDLAENWKYVSNLPVTQFYKVAVDDRKPFYHIFGGTQDNGSHGGASRTDNIVGIRNQDWYKTLYADGHQSATEPGNPDIIYAESQQGGLHRRDQITGEQIYIQPQARPGDDPERFNWDAPIVVSPHKPSRIYFASQRVWRSEDRGDSWTPISEDLTRNQERLALPIMGSVQSFDNPWDVYAMSNYNSITSLSESPIEEGLIYAGTDDGIIQVTSDGGSTWTKIEVSSLSGVPRDAFVNDIKADLHDVNTAYVALDNHKNGDYKPYLFKTTNRGKSWSKITSGLPDKTLVWRTVQDHVDPNILFAATEFGIYYSLTGGNHWDKISGKIPTISFRDLAIQKRENDLVGASFGRGFFVLDDYSFLREISGDKNFMNKEAHLFNPKDALWYRPRYVVTGIGADKWHSDNPPFGATFTYYVKDGYESLSSQRKKAEKEAIKNKQSVPFPGWDKLDKETEEVKPELVFEIRDQQGNFINRVTAPVKKGINQITWDLNYSSKTPIDVDDADERQWGMTHVTPGTYQVTMMKVMNGKTETLSEPVSFKVVPLHEKTALKGKSYAQINDFRERMDGLMTELALFRNDYEKTEKKLGAFKVAAERAPSASNDLITLISQAQSEWDELDRIVNGSSAKAKVGELDQKNMQSYIYLGLRALSTTYGPTKEHMTAVDTGETLLKSAQSGLTTLKNGPMSEIEAMLKKAGAPIIID